MTIYSGLIRLKNHDFIFEGPGYWVLGRFDYTRQGPPRYPATRQGT
jgi:hypothetical protein